MTQTDLAPVVSRSDRVQVHQGGSGVEGAEEGVAYQEVEAMHHDELRLGKDSGRIGVGEELWRGVVDQGLAKEYSRTGGGAPPSRADGEKRHDQRHDDWSEMSDSGDSLITEVLRASNMDPHNSKMREAMAHMLRKAQTLVGQGTLVAGQ
jgi:hypothetical protein